MDDLTKRLVAGDEDYKLHGPYIFQVECPCGHVSGSEITLSAYRQFQESKASLLSGAHEIKGRTIIYHPTQCWGHDTAEEIDEEDEEDEED